MLRRLTACVLALLMLAAVPARAAEIADLAVVSQWDERFFGKEYMYGGNHFRFSGCGPASVANALIAVLGVTDDDTATGLTRDVLYLLTRYQPNKHRMQIRALNYLNFTDPAQIADPLYPTLNRLLQDYNGLILYSDQPITTAELEKYVYRLNGHKALFHSALSKTNRWAQICAMARVLLDNGYEDADIVIAFQGAGTVKTRGPFRSGTSGHYLSVYIPLREFVEEGAFYVLDSMPRALDGEDYAPNQLPYMLKYDFAGSQLYYGSLREFNERFTVERVKNTIVRVRPIGEALAAFNAAGEDERDIDLLEPYLEEYAVFVNTSHIMFSLPEK